MKKYILTSVLSLCAFTFGTQIALAKTINMRPGLWEVKTSSDLLNIVPHIPADQMQNMRAIVEDYGLEMPKIENGAAITTTCITQEMVTQKKLPQFYQSELGCTSKEATREGNTYQIKFSCDSQDLVGNGTAEALITSSQSFTGTSQFIGKAQGTPINEKAEINGKWIGANCGKTKPQ